MRLRLYLFIILLISMLLFNSCIKDRYSMRKDMLLVFYGKMHHALIKDNKKWFEKNFYENKVEKINKDILFKNDDSLKNFVIKDSNKEHSITFKYSSGFDSLSSHLGAAAIIIRNNKFPEKYYYIRLFYDDKQKNWFIDEIL